MTPTISFECFKIPLLLTSLPNLPLECLSNTLNFVTPSKNPYQPCLPPTNYDLLKWTFTKIPPVNSTTSVNTPPRNPRSNASSSSSPILNMKLNKCSYKLPMNIATTAEIAKCVNPSFNVYGGPI
jgi:hypothetical protein